MRVVEAEDCKRAATGELRRREVLICPVRRLDARVMMMMGPRARRQDRRSRQGQDNQIGSHSETQNRHPQLRKYHDSVRSHWWNGVGRVGLDVTTVFEPRFQTMKNRKKAFFSPRGNRGDFGFNPRKTD